MISELGPRVSADVERERKLEEERRAELRKRLEEKREREKQGKGFHHGLIQFCRAAIFGTSRRYQRQLLRSHTQFSWRCLATDLCLQHRLPSMNL